MQFSVSFRHEARVECALRAIRGACVHRLHVSMVSMCALLESSSRRRATRVGECRQTGASDVARGDSCFVCPFPIGCHILETSDPFRKGRVSVLKNVDKP